MNQLVRFQKISFCLLALAFLCFACSKPSKSKLLIQPTWKFSDVTSTSSDSTVLSALIQNRIFLKEQELKFNEDRTFMSSFPSSNNQDQGSQGEWTIDSDETIITLFTMESKTVWDIQVLDEMTLEMKRFDSNLNADLNYRYTRK